MAQYLDLKVRGRPPSRRDQVELLGAVTLFANCSKRDLRDLARVGTFVQLEPDRHIVEEGSVSESLYVIIAGQVTVRRKGRKIATLGKGDVVGELGVILDRDRRSTVTADTPTGLIRIPKRELRRLIDEIPGLGWKLLTTVAARLSDRQSNLV